MKRSRGRTQVKRSLNKLETEFEKYLEVKKLALDCHDVVYHSFEPVKLRLGPNWKTSYCPDFMVMDSHGFVTFYEVKGFWEDDARVKIKVAAEMYPLFRFVAVQKKNGAWIFESFPPHDA